MRMSILTSDPKFGHEQCEGNRSFIHSYMHSFFWSTIQYGPSRKQSFYRKRKQAVLDSVNDHHNRSKLIFHRLHLHPHTDADRQETLIILCILDYSQLSVRFNLIS